MEDVFEKNFYDELKSILEKNIPDTLPNERIALKANAFYRALIKLLVDFTCTYKKPSYFNLESIIYDIIANYPNTETGEETKIFEQFIKKFLEKN